MTEPRAGTLRIGAAALAAVWLFTAAAAVWLFTAAAAAQGFDAQQFQPVPNQQDNYFSVHSARVLPHGGLELGALVDYANDPLIVVDGSGDRVASLIEDQLTLDAMIAVGLFDHVELGADMPFILVQKGDDSPAGTGIDVPDAGAGVGDLHLTLKLMFFNADTDDDPGGAALGLVVDGQLPTGNSDELQGEGLRIEPRLVLDYAFGRVLKLSAQVGYLVRPETTLLGADVNDSLTFGLGADVAFDSKEAWHLLLEGSAEVSVLADELDANEVPMALTIGPRYIAPFGLMFELAGGFGINEGFGTPDYRLIAALTFRTVPDEDPDHDGLFGDDDRCPKDPEDKDRFEDEDGCPELDNDKDGVPDTADRCALEPEDADGFEDADGCPDPDNDKDGVLDGADGCPLEAEDTDAFADEDGCPEPDNDKDEILDTDDNCPNEAEDVDQFEDQDGCPDPDNDKDGVPDVQDECPITPGDRSTKGCPKRIRIEESRIVILERVEFAVNKDTILKPSEPVLEDVRTVIATNPRIVKVRVEGHTDSRGPDKKNLELSRRRARSVTRWLTAHGIEADRLEAWGCGETLPLEDNKSNAGRQANRRVEFHIVDPAPKEGPRSPPGCVKIEP